MSSPNEIIDYQESIKKLYPDMGLLNARALNILIYGMSIAEYAFDKKNEEVFNDSSDAKRFSEVDLSEAQKNVTKASIAHKVLLDRSDGTNRIFARGLHPKIYNIDFVIEAFKNKAYRHVEKSPKSDEEFSSFIFLDHEDFDIEQIKNSKLIRSLSYISDKVSQELFKIFVIDNDKDVKDLKAPNILFKDRVKLDGTPISISEFDSFSVFGNFIRVRSHRDPANKALINFGDQNLATELSLFHERLCRVSQEVKI